MSKVIQVDIHGQRYGVRSDLDPQYIAELASFLDDRMRAAAREVAGADPLRIAVIAALNLADELHRARADTAGVEHRWHARAAEIERILDAVLEDARVRAVNE
jgi:cell division protein ZapA